MLIDSMNVKTMKATARWPINKYSIYYFASVTGWPIELGIKRFSPETSVRLGFMSAALFRIDSRVLYYDEVLIGFIESILLPECDPSCHCFDSILKVIRPFF